MKPQCGFCHLCGTVGHVQAWKVPRNCTHVGADLEQGSGDFVRAAGFAESDGGAAEFTQGGISGDGSGEGGAAAVSEGTSDDSEVPGRFGVGWGGVEWRFCGGTGEVMERCFPVVVRRWAVVRGKT